MPPKVCYLAEVRRFRIVCVKLCWGILHTCLSSRVFFTSKKEGQLCGWPGAQVQRYKGRPGFQVHKGRHTRFLELEALGGTAECRPHLCAMRRDTESQGGQVGCLGTCNHRVVTVAAVPGASVQADPGRCSF